MNNLPLTHSNAPSGVGRVYGRLLAMVGIFAFLFTAQAQMFGQSLIRGKVQDASTREYMENVTVTVEETGQSTLTDQYGEYRLNRVPEGVATLTLTHSGYFEGTQQVTVSNGSVATPEVVLLKGRGAFDSNSDSDEVYQLEDFKVRKEMDAFSRAINKQRVSDYNVNVVDSGTFGDVTEGNVGEFVKNLPGVNINYVAADARTITVRGMADNFTPVTVDGNRMASAASGAKARDFELEQLSINNIERVEVAKVPTADMAADSLGGAVNLVSKNAFERDGREIKYRVYVSANDENFSLGQSPGHGDGLTPKIKPGFDFSYADVFMDGTLGLMFNMTNSNQYNEQHRVRTRWVTDNSGEGIGTPLLRRFYIQDGPKFTNRQSYHVKADYKLGENTVISGSLQFNDYGSEFRNRNLTWDSNITSTTDSDGDEDDSVISSTYMLGDPGRGDIDLGGSWRNKYGDTWHGDFKIKHFGDVWTYEFGGFASSATNFYDDFSNGMIMAVIGDDDYRGRFEFSDVGDPLGGELNYIPTLTLYDENGNVDPGYGVSSLATFDLDEVQTREQDSQDDFTGVNFDMKRNIRIGELPGYLKMGARIQKQSRHADRNRTRIRHTSSVYDDTGLPAEQFYSGADALHLGPGIIQWPDYEDIYDYFEANPDNFDFNHSSRYVENITGAANDIYSADEKITAAYIMGQLKFMDSRLKMTTGVRYEKTELTGNGGFFNESLGDGIDDPVAKLMAQWSERKTTSASYDDLHPSLHFAYDISDKLLMRVAYANTIGRQNFSVVVPQIEIDSPDEDEMEMDGLVEFNNTGLLPQNADNYDITLEYYPDGGGSIAGGFFRKEISNYIISGDGLIGDLSDAEFQAFGLPSYLADTPEYSYETDVNGGQATIDGIELSYFRSLKHKNLPDWMSSFSVNANATYIDVKLNRDGVVENVLEDMVEETYNLGLTYDRDPWKVQIRFNSKGEQLVGNFTDLRTYDANGVRTDYFRLYRDKLEQVDLNFDYDINDKTKFFVSGRNIFNKEQKQFARNVEGTITIPERIEEYGVQWAIGIKGKF